MHAPLPRPHIATAWLPRAASRVALALLAMLLTACALPPLEGRSTSQALPPAESAATTLGRALAGPAAAHTGESGVLPLVDAREAFAARALLAHTAERTLDVQYYIWRDDTTGTLLLHALHQAAERGVRVRLLLDDNGIAGLDALLAALDTHANVEVRLFNPFTVRSPKAIGYLTHFSRANRRMHSKSFIADNQAAIVGGRNVGDEYFGATDGVLFADLDVLATGEVVPRLSHEFDRYWASASSYPLERLDVPPGDAALLRDSAARLQADPRAAGYLQAQRESAFIADLLAGRREPTWARVDMVSDDPAKGLGQAAPEGLVSHQLAQILSRPQRTVDLVSPYFVPTDAGVAVFTRLAAQGVRVRILTNALEATDVTAVHSGYARHRKALLRAGVQLFEMRRQVGDDREHGRAGLFGSSGSSLHAKTFSVDDRQVFVGSLNFDPRSIHLNTELGFIVHDETLARQLSQVFDTQVPLGAYEVRLDAKGHLTWVARDAAGTQTVLTREPGSHVGNRLWLRLLSVLPIEWML